MGAVSDIAQKTLTIRVARPAPRRLRYKGTRKARLWRLRAQAIALALALGAATSGCSMSYKLDSFFGKDEKDQTASLRPAPAPPRSRPRPCPRASMTSPTPRPPPRWCWHGRKGREQPWENPGTGARGTVTPIADAYTQDGFTCRDFLASYIRDGAESWLQGDACRIHQGKWTVRKMRPLKRS